MTGILIEAEAFDDHGGWVLDSQFEVQMGSPYLLAHGLGRPVADATTVVSVAEAGEHAVWVRAKDWVPGHAPGRFTLSIGGTEVGGELGANGRDWSWEKVGTVALGAGPTTVLLHDLTGFDGRCDAVYLTPDGDEPVDGADDAALAWRRARRGLPADPEEAGDFDVVVVGGGIAGCTAALTAARLGRRVALVQDRPVLGGNASREIGLSPRGENGGLVAELSAREGDGDLVARRLIEAEPTASVFMEHRVIAARTDGARITSIDAREGRTGREVRFSAPVFVDATGTAILGLLAGAQLLTGREGRDEHGEHYAPTARDEEHHGHTLFFRTAFADEPVDFPEVRWAIEVAKDYANLSGQLVEPGTENGPGPAASAEARAAFAYAAPDPAPGTDDLPVMQSFPATHFWEYGQFLDLYTDGERIRDHLLHALYGTFSNVKAMEPETFANLTLDWLAFVPAQGEFRRYRGDHVLTENEIRDHTVFPDAVVNNDGAFCIHIPHQPGESPYDFRLKDWVWDVRDNRPYAIPFRCLYSVDVENLLVAGKHISVTRVAGTTTKLMGNGGQHGIAVGVAAHLCATLDTTPRGILRDHLAELQDLVGGLTGCGHLHEPPASPAPTLTARQTVERHAAKVEQGDIDGLMADFVGNVFLNLMAGGTIPPVPTTEWKVLDESSDGDAVVFHVRYANDTDAMEMRTRWRRIGPDWKIVEATKVDA